MVFRYVCPKNGESEEAFLERVRGTGDPCPECGKLSFLEMSDDYIRKLPFLYTDEMKKQDKEELKEELVAFEKEHGRPMSEAEIESCKEEYLGSGDWNICVECKFAEC